MDPAEFAKSLFKGETTFNNGGKQVRYIVGFDGFYVYYKTKLTSNRTRGESAASFMKWAKGVGAISCT
ncbi:hypothetical protein [Paenibacillus polymyxa]|uniref:Uncharacterized protein n=1 Tax=Paenibacillus polymyxa (strain SC2) TaxID=886882 RepID=E3EK80_PAEPS|nr:hypothetical protein [Paenibacillus polymyxa]ADO59407.1 hypothetical protein PPSC2_28020 [Paenibacillus polymyxa SC2]WPQ59752.1 hypothetical protein SKN87_26040 [Paenibacillus polymyxa]